MNRCRLRTVTVLVLLGLGPMARADPSQGPRYVAMGSSYAAGPGVGTPEPGANACARSLSNFAHLVAGRRHWELHDVSCAGATTANILDHGQHGDDPQIAAITPDTAFVSVLVGGNDVDYIPDLIGLSCRDTGGANCHVANPAEVEARLAGLPSALDRVVGAVRQRAPRARIVLVGYLPVVSDPESLACPGLPLAPADAARARGVATRLARIIGGAAKRNNTGIVRAALLGTDHDVCAAEPYVAGYAPETTPGWPRPVAYHPNQAGMQAVADALDREFDR